MARLELLRKESLVSSHSLLGVSRVIVENSIGSSETEGTMMLFLATGQPGWVYLAAGQVRVME